MLEKCKNTHYLNKYSSIQEAFNLACENEEKKNIAISFSNLEACVKEIAKELIKETDWFKNNKENGNTPKHEEIVKRLEREKILNEKQVDLFNSIVSESRKYLNSSANESKKEQVLETLRNFIVRLDGELPSLMAHLGVGGADRFKYINNNGETVQDGKSVNPPLSEVKKEKIKDKATKVIKDKKDKITNTIKKATNSKAFYAIKFVVVLVVFIFLFNITFINKKSSKELEATWSVICEKEENSMKEMKEDAKDLAGEAVNNIEDGILNFFDFMTFDKK